MTATSTGRRAMLVLCIAFNGAWGLAAQDTDIAVVGVEEIVQRHASEHDADGVVAVLRVRGRALPVRWSEDPQTVHEARPIRDVSPERVIQVGS